jgi:sugar lactone lactonase YvrE
LWDAERGLVWWVDIKSPAIHAHHVATGANRVQPTFAGERLDRLYVTSATVGLSTEMLAGQPLAGGLLALAPGIRGRPPARFAG